jgi:predicted transport protein
MSLRPVGALMDAPSSSKTRFEHVLALGAALRAETFRPRGCNTNATIEQVTQTGDELMAEYRAIEGLRKEQKVLEEQISELLAEKEERLQKSRDVLNIGCYASETVAVNQMKYIDLITNLFRAKKQRKALEEGNERLRKYLDVLISYTATADL